MERLELLNQHFISYSTNLKQAVTMIGDDEGKYPEILEHKPSQRIKLDFFNKQGWGYQDSYFVLDEQKQMFKLSGNRYIFSDVFFPHLKKFVEEQANIDFNYDSPKQEDMEIDPPILNHKFLQELGEKGNFERRSFMKWERIMHSHGATLQEVFILRHGKFKRCVDCVIYPTSHEQVETLVQLANKHNVVLVAYGGGTNVTQSLMLSERETRMIISVDMTRMCRIKWVDKINMLACIETGIIGQDLERELKTYGVCCGHEPDSIEFSSLGGWIATRASGMKKNVYGNIEDIVQNVKIVTPVGTYTKLSEFPRISAGPDLNHFIMGHEGNLGIVTEAVLRIRNIPPVKRFGSIIFPNFEIGIKFMEEVAKSRIWPASIRLVDNLQFKFGQSFKPEEHSKAKELIDAIKKYYVLNIKGFDQDQMVACTLAFEGTKDQVKTQENYIFATAKKYQGMSGGEENGIRGYFLTYVIAYIRDFACQYNFVAESFETSVPFSNVSILCKNVGARLIKACKDRGIPEKSVFGSFRVTQLYETGAAIYVYFGFGYLGIPLDKVVKIYEAVEDECRDEILKNGGSISHHHGVGKIRKRYIKRMMSPLGIEMIKKMKELVDPNNIMAINNTVFRYDGEEEDDLKHIQ